MLSLVEHLWGSSPKYLCSYVAPTLVTIPYQFPRHLVKVQQERLAIIYGPQPVTCLEAQARESAVEEEFQFTAAIAAYSRLVSDFEVQVLLGLHRSLPVAPLPDLPLARRRTFRSSRLRPVQKRPTPYSRLHPY